MARASLRRKKAADASKRELKRQEACAALRDGSCSTVTEAAKVFDIPYATLRRRHHGLTRPKVHAHENQMLISLAQEAVVCEWLAYLGATAHPISRRSIAPKVEAICGTWPSKSWIRSFLVRNPVLVLGRPRGLDPKRARAFNFTTVEHHFELLQEYINKHNIPWENVYNMDEKGIQLGGGRKGTQQKYFFSRNDKAQAKIQSAALELVTVIEVVCADGSSVIKPGFVFSGVKMSEDWFCEYGAM
jgi:hypothetical protein